MDRQECREHFEMLELTTKATPAEIKKAYLILKDVYSKDSLAIMSMSDEISVEQTEDILQQIEESFQVLSELFSEEQNEVAEFVEQMVAEVTDFNGAILKEIRQKLEISLDDMAIETRVQYKHLLDIEADNFDELPVAVYTRGFVVNYANYLSLDPEVVVGSYMDNFRQHRKESDK
ncbi:MAG: helix-turn-helix domain-containing protein [Desulfobulbaceae bacterium]|nr:helix-turn-helix domain-containing protein [Desulfobulbaceae bacterium]